MPNLKISRNGILHLDASSPHPIKVCYSNKTLNIKAICKTFSSIPAWSLICAAQKTKKTKHIPSYNWSSPVSQSLNDPEMRLETVMSNGEERTLRCHTHIHSHSHTQITPSVTLPVTSDCWWRWRWHVFKRRTSRVREEESLFFFLFFPIALGHVFISDALSASCSLGAAFSFRELQKHASTATWGRGDPEEQTHPVVSGREKIQLRGRLFMLVFTMFSMSSMLPTLLTVGRRGGSGGGGVLGLDTVNSW